LPDEHLSFNNLTKPGHFPVAGVGDEFSLGIFGNEAFGDETVHQAGDGMA